MMYHNITTDDLLNGDGLRTVLWVSGCEHRCRGCQNPATWDVNDGLDFDVHAEAELYSHLYKDYISGVTFSGGDPLHPKNRDTVLRMASDIKRLFPTKTIWVYTGYLWEAVRNLYGMEFVDVLVDGNFVERLNSEGYHWAGSTNQRVVDVQKSLVDGTCILWES